VRKAKGWLFVLTVFVVFATGCLESKESGAGNRVVSQATTSISTPTGFRFTEGCWVSGGSCTGTISRDGIVKINFVFPEEKERHVFAGFVKDCEFTQQELDLIAQGQEINCDVRISAPKINNEQCNAESTSIAQGVVLKCPVLNAGGKYVVNFKVITFTNIPIEGSVCQRVNEEYVFKCFADGALSATAR